MNAIQQHFAATNRRQRLFSGPGARLHSTAFGTAIRFNGGLADFSHPWLTELAGDTAAALLPGFVNNIAGAIKGVPLAGTNKESPPVLRWTQLLLTPDDIGYFAAEVTCDPKMDWAVKTVEIVQVADCDTEDGKAGQTLNSTGAALPLSKNRARWPLAMIQRRSNGLLEVFQITFFNLTHRVKLKDDGKTALRHFFY